MKHLRYLLMAALVAMPLVACDEDDDGDTTPVTPVVITGTVSGTVSIEGTGVAGVSVSLVGVTSQTATTGSGGGYSFAGVEGGSYGVAISGIPSDATFATTSATTSITTNGATVTVDFSGSYIRTSSIAGQVMVDGMGIAGVSVTATGPEGAKSAVTDNAGSYNFSGLRAGDYAVALSNIPADYAFATATQTVTVGTGEAKIAGFYGAEVVTTADVTAEVVISSVTANNGFTDVPVNPAAVAGLININLEINPGQNDLTSVCVLLNGNDVDLCQTLGTSAPGQGAEMVDGNFNVQFTLNTALFDGTTGATEYDNGVYVLSAVLGLEGAKASSVETSMNLTFANADTFIGTVTPGATAIGANGLLYYGGSLVTAVTPVIYSGKTVSSVTTTFTNNGQSGGATAQAAFVATVPGLAVTDATAPFSTTYSSGVGGAIRNYQTLAANVGAEAITVTAALYSDGTVFDPTAAVLPVGLTGGATMTIDNAVPQFIGPDNIAATADDLIYGLPNQVTGATHPVSSSNNWIMGTFAMSTADLSTATATTRDNQALASGGPGVGGVVTTYHMGAATLTQAQVAALPAITTAADAGLGASLVNTAYEPVMVLTDALGNAAMVGLTATADNPSATTVGLDIAAPTAQAAAAPAPGALFADKVIYNSNSALTPAIDGVAMTATEDRAGFSATPVRMTMSRTTATNTRFVVGASTTAGGAVNEAATVNVCGVGAVPALSGAPCFPAKDIVGIGTATNTNAYYNWSANFVDQGGNEVATPVTRQWLLDDILPTTNNVTIPSAALVGGANTSFGFTVADNLDLWSVSIGFDFAAAGIFIPFGSDVSVSDGDRWDGAVTTTATGTFTFPFVRALELAPAGVPAGAMNAATNVRAITEDAAGNLSVPAANNFIAATVPAGTSFTTAPAMATWNPTAPAAAFNLCNGQGSVACPTAAGNGTSIAVTAQATGPSGIYPNPFANGTVYFYYVLDPTPAGYYSGDEAFFLAGSTTGTSATFTDTGAVRTYSWNFTLTSAMVASVTGGAGIQIVAIGTSANGDAILSGYNANVTVINGS